jgi:hypothetical protein
MGERVKLTAPDAVALTLFRILPSGDGREYSATTFPKDPWGGCERMIRTAVAVGRLKAPQAEGYGVLDVLNANGDIVEDFTVPDSISFQWLKRKLHLDVVFTDGDDEDECGGDRGS